MVGEQGTSITRDRYKPRIVAIPPTSKPIKIRTDQLLAKSEDIDAGIIRNMKIKIDNLLLIFIPLKD